MTNKIINGIDVSECKLYDYGICDSEMAENLNCEQNPDCYFKQLKRLQEENEELKARLKTLDDEILTIEITPDEFERHKKFKQALEEIRELIQKCEIEDISCVQCKERKRCHCDLTGLLVEKIDEVLKNE